MAEVVKAKKRKEIVKIEEETKKEKKVNKNTKSTKNEKNEESKNGLWTRFMIFCHGVKSETKKIRWTSKKDMFKYSIATIIFIVFCSLFFYAIDTIFALVQSLFN